MSVVELLSGWWKWFERQSFFVWNQVPYVCYGHYGKRGFNILLKI